MASIINNCSTELTTDFTQKCNDTLATGLENRIVLINHTDLDKTSVTDSPYATGKLASLSLKSGKSGIFVYGIGQENTFSVSFSAKETGRNGVGHSLIINVPNPTAEERAQINSLVIGQSMAAVVEKKNKGGAQERAFEVFGFDNGMVLSDITYASVEGGGNVVITLSSSENSPERGVPLLLGDAYGTTKAAFDKKFSSAVQA